MNLANCIDHHYAGTRSNLALFDFSDADMIGTEPQMPR
jgi:hypothetical protein